MHDFRLSNVRNLAIACVRIALPSYVQRKFHRLISISVFVQVDAAIQMRHALDKQPVKRVRNLVVNKGAYVVREARVRLMGKGVLD